MSCLLLRRGLRPARRALIRSYAAHPDKPVDYDLENYPKLPNVSRQYLSPYGWDDMQTRRNRGDPLHEQEELYSMWGPDIPAVAPETAIRHFGLAVLGFVGIGLAVRFILHKEPPMVRREYPFGGLSRELGGYDDNKARAEDESEAE
ncbi:hypothetical protein C8J56DRAFT_1045726 [Mycena floridula]|nr:hypothetical protein C8J56DRAFT_1045726 [Mycena floridula]